MGVQLVHDFRMRIGAVESSAETTAKPIGESSGPARLESGSNLAPTSLEGCERILLVDDDRYVRNLVRAVLGYRGYKVIEATSAEEALGLHAAALEPFHLLMTDLELPGMDGLELLRLIRTRQPTIACMVLTGDHPDEALEEDLERETAICLLKPFENNEVLVMTVRQVLDQKV